MKAMKYYIFSVYLLMLVSCEEKTRHWKNDFIGSWKATTTHGIFYETWQHTKNKLIGIGFEVGPKGDTLFGEKLELFERAESLVYVAYPGNNRRVEFIGKRNAEGRYIFENKKNDFPATIEYVFNDEKLRVNLSGVQNGTKVTDHLHMVSVK